MVYKQSSRLWRGSRISSIRTHEEKRRFTFHRLSEDDKKKLLQRLKSILEKRDEILLAVVYGGFVKNKFFRDIDLALFTGYKIPYNKAFEYEDLLREELEEKLGFPFDVSLIDYAPSWFRVEALKGIVIIEKQPALAIRLWFKSLQEVRDIEMKIRLIKMRRYRKNT